MRPGALVKLPMQPIEYSPLVIETGVRKSYPVGLTASENL
jgi:hypothetical protein